MNRDARGQARKIWVVGWEGVEGLGVSVDCATSDDEGHEGVTGDKTSVGRAERGASSRQRTPFNSRVV